MDALVGAWVHGVVPGCVHGGGCLKCCVILPDVGGGGRTISELGPDHWGSPDLVVVIYRLPLHETENLFLGLRGCVLEGACIHTPW